MSDPIWVQVRIANSRNRRRGFSIKALVDNGSLDSAMPRVLLHGIGVKPEGWETYEAWAGKRHRRQWGEAKIAIQGRCRTSIVTFEPKGEIPTIGALALETLGFDIEMMNGRLRPARRIGRGPRLRAKRPLRASRR